MPANPLESMQRDFVEWILGAPGASIEALVDGRGLESTARLRIYRNIVFNNFTEALSTAYPMVKRLVGEAFFESVCASYVKAHPSTSGKLQEFGKYFPRLLAATQEAAGLGYLPHVARLEWARQESALAPLNEPVAPGAIAVIPAASYDRLRLVLHPSLRLIASDYPVLDIWLYCDEPGDRHLNIDGDGQRIAVWRSGEQIAMTALDADWYSFVSALWQGADLGEAHNAAAGDNFDPARPLQWLFGQGLVTAIHE